MKTTVVAITGAATPILANIPAKFVRVREDALAASKVLIANLRNSDGSFSPDVYFQPNVTGTLTEDITVHSSVGILARPAGYSYSGQPAEAYMKLRTQDGSSINVILIEHENNPKGNY